MTRIADTRKMTLEEADAEFETLARAQIRVWRREGVAEDKIATVKSKEVEDNAEDRSTIAMAKVKIAAFVLAFKSLFQKPRKRKTQWGSYGLETERELVIDDEEKLIAELREKGCADCIRTTPSVLKAKVTERIDRGEKFSCCRISEGDVVKYKVDKSLMDTVAVTDQAAAQ